jgi:repressor LexA
MATVPLTRRQQEILEYLRAYTSEHEISPTLEEIAQHLGVNKVTIFGHISEMERKGVISRAARGVSRGLRVIEDDPPSPETVVSILGNIAAGSPIEALEHPEQLDLADLLPRGHDVYALRVRGDSMIDDAICDGDIALIEPRTTPNNGETVVAILEGEGATLKRFYREGNSYRLQPANATMEPILVDDVTIRGVLIGVVRQL